MKKIIILTVALLSFPRIQAQNDSIYFWKAGTMIRKHSIKTVDLDSITYKRPTQFVADMPSVTICNQIWTTLNLDVSAYRDGTLIPQVQDPTQWANLTTGAWCYYNNDPANGPIYGKLYNWYAVAGVYDAASAANPALRKKLAPTGWHVPTDVEWTQLINCLGGQSVAGGKMKTTGTIQSGTGLWAYSNLGATNESGFSGLPGGTRSTNGTDNNISYYGNWWSSLESSTTNAWCQFLTCFNGNSNSYSNFKYFGFSVRCIRN